MPKGRSTSRCSTSTAPSHRRSRGQGWPALTSWAPVPSRAMQQLAGGEGPSAVVEEGPVDLAGLFGQVRPCAAGAAGGVDHIHWSATSSAPSGGAGGAGSRSRGDDRREVGSLEGQWSAGRARREGAPRDRADGARRLRGLPAVVPDAVGGPAVEARSGPRGPEPGRRGRSPPAPVGVAVVATAEEAADRVRDLPLS